MTEEERRAELDAALKATTGMDAVRLERADGTTELLIYGTPEGADGGTLIIPAELMDFTPPDS